MGIYCETGKGMDDFDNECRNTNRCSVMIGLYWASRVVDSKMDGNFSAFVGMIFSRTPEIM
jgi:hypothetical protein